MRQQWVGMVTIARKETRRFLRLWIQTLFPAMMTTMLYFFVFGHVIGRRIGPMEGVDYIHFIAPGLILMQIINASYSGSMSAFFHAKFQRSIEELLVSPMNVPCILLGYMFGGVCRGMLVGCLVTVVTACFISIKIHFIVMVFASALLSSCLFALAGLINGIFAQSFDSISIVPVFVLTPLTYIGGVFYSISLLPTFWQKVSTLNPLVYLIGLFRYGFTQVGTHHSSASLLLMLLMVCGLFFSAYLCFTRSKGMRY